MHGSFALVGVRKPLRVGPWLLMAGLSALPACERSPLPTAGRASGRLKRARVVVIAPGSAGPRWPAVRAGVRQALGSYEGLRIKWRTVTPATPAALAGVLEHEATRTADGVVIYWPARLDSEPLPESFAPDRQIVVVIGPRRVPPGVYGLVRVAWAAGADRLAERLHTLRGDPKSLLLLHRAGCQAWGRRLRDRFMLALGKQGRVALLDEADLCGADDAAGAIRPLVTRFAHAGVLVSLDGRVWDEPGAWQAVPARMPIATLGADPRLWPLMRAGRAVALVGPLDGKIGEAAGALLVSGLADGTPGPHVRTIECELVRPETLDDFVRRYQQAAATQPGP